MVKMIFNYSEEDREDKTETKNRVEENKPNAKPQPDLSVTTVQAVVT